MRKLVLSLAIILISIAANAQFKYTTDNVKDLRTLADSIASNAKRSFNFISEGVSTEDENYYILKYATADAAYKLNVVYRISMAGESDALETAGKAQYTLYFVSGAFLDIFPFYQKFINPSAIAENVVEMHEAKSVKDGCRFSLREATADIWRMDCRAVAN